MLHLRTQAKPHMQRAAKQSSSSSKQSEWLVEHEYGELALLGAQPREWAAELLRIIRFAAGNFLRLQ